MYKQTLFLMVGIPGAGKTTAAKLLAEITGASHIWADHERRLKHPEPSYSQVENDELYIKLNEQVEALLQKNKSVIYDTAFNHIKDRDKLRRIASNYNVDTVVVWVQAPKLIAKHRAQNAHNHAHTRVLGDMSDEHFGSLSDKLEPPLASEKTIILDGTKLTLNYIKASLVNL